MPSTPHHKLAADFFAALVGDADDGWQDISTAPKDGTRLWLYFPERHADDRQAIGWYEVAVDWEGFIDHADSSFVDDQPTHWRPLPAPPRTVRS